MRVARQQLQEEKEKAKGVVGGSARRRGASRVATVHTDAGLSNSLDLDVELLGEGLGGGGLGALDGAALEAVPDKAGQNADLAGDAEEDGVVVLLGEAVVLEEDTGVGID
eukprot:161212_1